MPDRSAVRPDPAVITTLVRAASTSRQVSLGYRSEAGREWESVVDPWAIVVRHGRWYLLCWSHHSDATRAYRIDRVTGARVLDAGFRPPHDLDPVAALEEHLAVGWDHPVEVVIEAPLERIGWLPRHLGRLEAIDESDHPADRQHEQRRVVRRGAGAAARPLPRGGRRRGPRGRPRARPAPARGGLTPGSV